MGEAMITVQCLLDLRGTQQGTANHRVQCSCPAVGLVSTQKKLDKNGWVGRGGGVGALVAAMVRNPVTSLFAVLFSSFPRKPQKLAEKLPLVRSFRMKMSGG